MKSRWLFQQLRLLGLFIILIDDVNSVRIKLLEEGESCETSIANEESTPNILATSQAPPSNIHESSTLNLHTGSIFSNRPGKQEFPDSTWYRQEELWRNPSRTELLGWMLRAELPTLINFILHKHPPRLEQGTDADLNTLPRESITGKQVQSLPNPKTESNTKRQWWMPQPTRRNLLGWSAKPSATTSPDISQHFSNTHGASTSSNAPRARLNVGNGKLVPTVEHLKLEWSREGQRWRSKPSHPAGLGLRRQLPKSLRREGRPDISATHQAHFLNHHVASISSNHPQRGMQTGAGSQSLQNVANFNPAWHTVTDRQWWRSRPEDLGILGVAPHVETWPSFHPYNLPPTMGGGGDISATSQAHFLNTQARMIPDYLGWGFIHPGVGQQMHYVQHYNPEWRREGGWWKPHSFSNELLQRMLKAEAYVPTWLRWRSGSTSRAAQRGPKGPQNTSKRPQYTSHSKPPQETPKPGPNDNDFAPLAADKEYIAHVKGFLSTYPHFLEEWFPTKYPSKHEEDTQKSKKAYPINTKQEKDEASSSTSGEKEIDPVGLQMMSSVGSSSSESREESSRSYPKRFNQMKNMWEHARESNIFESPDEVYGKMQILRKANEGNQKTRELETQSELKKILKHKPKKATNQNKWEAPENISRSERIKSSLIGKQQGIPEIMDNIDQQTYDSLGRIQFEARDKGKGKKLASDLAPESVIEESSSNRFKFDKKKQKTKQRKPEGASPNLNKINFHNLGIMETLEIPAINVPKKIKKTSKTKSKALQSEEPNRHASRSKDFSNDNLNEPKLKEGEKPELKEGKNSQKWNNPLNLIPLQLIQDYRKSAAESVSDVFNGATSSLGSIASKITQINYREGFGSLIESVKSRLPKSKPSPVLPSETRLNVDLPKQPEIDTALYNRNGKPIRVPSLVSGMEKRIPQRESGGNKNRINISKIITWNEVFNTPRDSKARVTGTKSNPTTDVSSTFSQEDIDSISEPGQKKIVLEWKRKRVSKLVMILLAHHLKLNDNTPYLPLESNISKHAYIALEEAWQQKEISKAEKAGKKFLDDYEMTRRLLTFRQLLHSHTIAINWAHWKQVWLSKKMLTPIKISILQRVFGFSIHPSQVSRFPTSASLENFVSSWDSKNTVKIKGILLAVIGKDQALERQKITHYMSERKYVFKWWIDAQLDEHSRQYGLDISLILKIGDALQFGSRKMRNTSTGGKSNLMDEAFVQVLRIITDEQRLLPWIESPERAWLYKYHGEKYPSRLRQLGEYISTKTVKDKESVTKSLTFLRSRLGNVIVESSIYRIGHELSWCDVGLDLAKLPTFWALRNHKEGSDKKKLAKLVASLSQREKNALLDWHKTLDFNLPPNSIADSLIDAIIGSQPYLRLSEVSKEVCGYIPKSVYGLKNLWKTHQE